MIQGWSVIRMMNENVFVWTPTCTIRAHLSIFLISFLSLLDRSDSPECKNKFVRTTLQIVMAASVGKSYAGDIALDDISMSSGPCKVASSMRMINYSKEKTTNELVFPIFRTVKPSFFGDLKTDSRYNM